MTVFLPRLERDAAIDLINAHRHRAAVDVASALPMTDVEVTFSTVGGSGIPRDRLARLRDDLVGLALESGMPAPDPSQAARTAFDGEAARMLHEQLGITPHEASEEAVWSYLTVCWLLDVALWRFTADGSDDRFVGHINRNTFRRLWWRAETFGRDIDLRRLGEDELVNIMERPTLAQNRTLARAIACEFLDRVEADASLPRMFLMRQVTVRLLRLTPFVEFRALSPKDVHIVVGDAFNATLAARAGENSPMQVRVRSAPTPRSEGVTILETVAVAASSLASPATEGARNAGDLSELGRAALAIARRTGSVTNMQLREVAPVSADEAREVFRLLMDEGRLVRRGVKRGTHYVLPEMQPEKTGASASHVSPSRVGETETTQSSTRSVAQKPRADFESLRKRLKRRVNR